MVITILVDHPLDVPLSPAHLLFFLAFPFPFEPALHPKARAKVRGLALKGDFIDRLLLVAKRFVVSRNPYQLAADIYGIGFITADTIARSLGIAPDSDVRYQAGLLYLLSQAAEDGHCFVPAQKLVEEASKHLALPEFPVDPARISALIAQMAETKHLIVEPGYGDLADQQVCYTPAFYHTEVALASRLCAFARTPVDVDVPRV